MAKKAKKISSIKILIAYLQTMLDETVFQSNKFTETELKHSIETDLDPCKVHVNQNQTGLQQSEELQDETDTTFADVTVSRCDYHDDSFEVENGDVYYVNRYMSKMIDMNRSNAVKAKEPTAWATTSKEKLMASLFTYMVKNSKFFTVKAMTDMAVVAKWNKESKIFFKDLNLKKGLDIGFAGISVRKSDKFNFDGNDSSRFLRHKKIISILIREKIKAVKIPENRRAAVLKIVAADPRTVAGSIRHYWLSDDPECSFSYGKEMWEQSASFYIRPTDAMANLFSNKVDPEITLINEDLETLKSLQMSDIYRGVRTLKIKHKEFEMGWVTTGNKIKYMPRIKTTVIPKTVMIDRLMDQSYEPLSDELGIIPEHQKLFDRLKNLLKMRVAVNKKTIWEDESILFTDELFADMHTAYDCPKVVYTEEKEDFENA